MAQILKSERSADRQLTRQTMAFRRGPHGALDTLQAQADDSAVTRRILQLQGLAPVQRIEEEELLQGRFDGAQIQRIEEEELMQGKFEGAQNDGGLPKQLQAGLESLSGVSMESTQVHYNSDKPASVQAHAYAQGDAIHLAPGQEKHLPHEAWHVVQQKQGRVKPTMQVKGAQINDDPALESEADVMGLKAAQIIAKDVAQ